MQITKHFSLLELTRSQTATRRNINNKPDEKVIDSLTVLCNELLEKIRELAGKPITINSGYRSKELNSAIGGSKTSQHCKGEAVDIVCNSLGSSKKLFDLIVASDLDYDQIIEEFGSWVHISYKKEGNRKQKLVAKKVNNKTIYEEV